MKEEQKKNILARYKSALHRGERFWPDSIYKDILVSLGIFILLVLLATFIGVPTEPKADPSDTTYVPKPEWYFLFLFKFLAVYGQIPVLGKIEWVATIIVPAFVLILLFVLPLVDRNPFRHYSRRTMALSILVIFVVNMVVLTSIAGVPVVATGPAGTVMTMLQFVAGLILPLLAYLVVILSAVLPKKTGKWTSGTQVWTAGGSAALMAVMAVAVLLLAPPSAATTTEVAATLPEQIALGQDLYSINCAECHGPDGEGGIIQGVEGLEGFDMKAIHSQDEMYTRTDETLADIVSYGQPVLGMQPFGRVYGGLLSPTEIDSIVAFMRYSWDDRAQIPAGAITSIPALGANEVPSWDVHIQALVKRYCVSCHRAGKQNNNYLMTSYDDMLNSGDNAPVISAGDPDSLLLTLINGHEGLDPATGKTIRQMPPTTLLNKQYVDMLTIWVMSGMPKTAEEASKLTPPPVAGDAINLTGDPVAGQLVFVAQCEVCHGPQGTQGVLNPGSTDGTVPVLNPIDPAIKNADLKIFTTNIDLFIQSGSTPEGESPKLTMPSFGRDGVLTQQQIADVIAYVISLNP
jgi:mono/diheme cytochrome c family protein